MSEKDAPIKLLYAIEANINTVWIALTDLTEMRKGFFAEIPSFKAEKGFEGSFDI